MRVKPFAFRSRWGTLSEMDYTYALNPVGREPANMQEHRQAQKLLSDALAPFWNRLDEVFGCEIQTLCLEIFLHCDLNPDWFAIAHDRHGNCHDFHHSQHQSLLRAMGLALAKALPLDDSDPIVAHIRDDYIAIERPSFHEIAAALDRG